MDRDHIPQLGRGTRHFQLTVGYRGYVLYRRTRRHDASWNGSIWYGPRKKTYGGQKHEPWNPTCFHYLSKRPTRSPALDRLFETPSPAYRAAIGEIRRKLYQTINLDPRKVEEWTFLIPEDRLTKKKYVGENTFLMQRDADGYTFLYLDGRQIHPEFYSNTKFMLEEAAQSLAHPNFMLDQAAQSPKHPKQMDYFEAYRWRLESSLMEDYVGKAIL